MLKLKKIQEGRTIFLRKQNLKFTHKSQPTKGQLSKLIEIAPWLVEEVKKPIKKKKDEEINIVD